MYVYIYRYSNINHLGAQPPIALWFLGVGHQTLSTSPAVLNRKLDNVADFTKPRVLSNRPNGFYQTAGRFLLWAPRTNRDPKRQDCALFSNWSQGSWSVWNMKAKPNGGFKRLCKGKVVPIVGEDWDVPIAISSRELDITRNTKHLQNR